MSSPAVNIGSMVVGEKPAPIEYQFQDASGVPIPLTAYTAKFVIREERSTTAQTFNATVTDVANGKVTYVWVGNEFSTSGHWMGEFWVGNGVQRFCSWLITWDVRVALGTVPSI
jgi:hypothetical protein